MGMTGWEKLGMLCYAWLGMDGSGWGRKYFSGCAMLWDGKDGIGRGGLVCYGWVWDGYGMGWDGMGIT